MAIEPGRVLSQRYRLIRPVGQGSQASVWVAEHLALTTHVAVKLIDPELAKKETARERFRREATAAAQLRSAHVVQILDHGIDGDQPFIVMELLDGEDLFERLAHRTRLTLRETSKIVTQVARALNRAHAAGVVHRDLKPENVFLVSNDDDEVVKVLDFGVAKVKDAAKVTMQKTGIGMLIGTPHYMSPEQVKGIGEVDHRTDIWALGVIAFQCVTGELPFDSEGVGDLLITITIGDIPVPSAVYPGLPASFDAWFARACARDCANRFQSARELAVALAAAVASFEGNARSPTLRPPSPVGFKSTSRLPRGRDPIEDEESPDPAQHVEEIEAFDDDFEDAGVPPLVPQPTLDAPPVRLPPRPASRVPSESPAAHDDGHDIVFDDTGPHERPPAPDGWIERRPAPPASTRPGSTPAPRASNASNPPPSSKKVPPPPPSMRAPPPPSTRPPMPSPAGMQTPVPGAASTPVPASMRTPVAVAIPTAPVSSPPASVRISPSSPSLEALPPPSTPKPPRPPRPPAPSPAPAPIARPLDSASRVGLLPSEAPPEFDGTRRNRMVRYLVVGLLLLAAVLTFAVVRSQLELNASGPVVAGGAGPTAATTATAPVSKEPPVAPASASALTPGSKAVDPGQVTRPIRPKGTKPGPTPQPRRAAPQSGVVELPDPDEDSP